MEFVNQENISWLPLLQEAESFGRNAISLGTQGRPFLNSPAITSETTSSEPDMHELTFSQPSV